MRSPLDGLTVLDMTIWQNGPFATVMLSDMGANVIKIEDPVNGDPGRTTGSLTAHLKRENFYFQTMNRNKQSMTLNLKSQQGREIFYKMAKNADVVTQNFRVGVVEKLGVDYETIKKHNPKIIYASSSGLGPKGPDAKEGVMDILGQARSGYMWLGSVGEKEVSYRLMGGVGDQIGAITLAYGVLLGVIARERYGIGQHIESSQLGSMVMLQAMALNSYLINGDIQINRPRTEAPNPLWNIYRCSDDKWLALGCTQSDRFWSDFVRVLGIEQVEGDARFKDHATRGENCQPLIEIIDKVFLTKSRDEWVKALREPAIYCAPVQDFEDLAKDPQVLENGYITEVPHPTLGTLTEAGVAVALSETPGAARKSAPEYGEHTEEILLANGYDWEQIAEFRGQGVI